jgi:hypothetical protein
VAINVTIGHTFPPVANLVMQTRNSSPPQPPEGPPAPLEPSGKAQWSEADEIALIEYITDHRAEAGDGMKFKASFWTGAAKEMLAHSNSGGTKTPAGCSSKWDRVCTNIVLSIYPLMPICSSRNLIKSSLPSKPIHPDSLGVIPEASISQYMRLVHGMNTSRYVPLTSITPFFLLTYF